MSRLATAMVASKPGFRPGWTVDDAVTRISMLHYNTPEEVEHVIQSLMELL